MRERLDCKFEVLEIVSVMPGLVPGIHVMAAFKEKDVDGRVKPGHDELNGFLIPLYMISIIQY
jgi:hypothetical protein